MDRALATAVAILVALPDVKIDKRRKVKAWDASNFEEVFDPSKFPEELKACRVLANSYRQALDFELSSTGLAPFIKAMRNIQNLSGQLAAALEGLGADEKFFLDTVFDEDERVSKILLGLRGKLKGLPNPATSKPGALSRQLKALREFLTTYISVLEKRLGAKDGKFRRNSPPLWRVATRSPIWRLIGESWVICSRRPHLTTKKNFTSAHTAFVIAIHQHVTREKETAFKKPLKRYRALKAAEGKLLHRLGPPTSEKEGLAIELKKVEFRLHHEFYPNEKRK